MTDWVREHASPPEVGSTAGHDTGGEAVSATSEPSTSHSDIERTLSAGQSRLTLSRLDVEPLTPGGRTWDARDVGASVEFFTSTQATDTPNSLRVSTIIHTLLTISNYVFSPGSPSPMRLQIPISVSLSGTSAMMRRSPSLSLSLALSRGGPGFSPVSVACCSRRRCSMR